MNKFKDKFDGCFFGSKKFAYNNEKDNYPYPTILNVF